MSVAKNGSRWLAFALLLVASTTRLGAQVVLPNENAPGSEAVPPVQTRAQGAPDDGPGRSWAGRHPVLLGTLIGAGSIAVLGAAGRRNGDAGIMGLWMLAGAGGGALTGSIVSVAQKGSLRYVASPNQIDALAVKRVVAGLGAGERIIVTAAGVPMNGRIQSIGGGEFHVVPDGQAAPRTIDYATVSDLRAKPAGTAKKVGIAAGIVGGIVASWLVCFGAGGCGGTS
ncbi:MAG: hypothetical protein ABI652_00675 [Acidobacteriota bacterium]